MKTEIVVDYSIGAGIFGAVITGFGMWAVALSIGMLPYSEDTNSAYGSIAFSLCIFSLGLYCVAQYVKLLRILSFIFFIVILCVAFVTKDKIAELEIKRNYKNIETNIVKSYPNIKNSSPYKEFLIDKESNNKDKWMYYEKNINKYISINPEKVMELKMFYTMTNNKEIQSKLDNIFQDGLVSKFEYEEFKDYVYQLDLTKEKDSTLLTILSK